MMRLLTIGLVAAAWLGGCKQTSKDFCCTTAAACKAGGAGSELHPCPDGQMCDNDGTNPASNGVAGTCVAGADAGLSCKGPMDCMADPAHPVCGPSGMCVECKVAGDCSATTPVCNELNECAGCTTRDECAGYAGTPACELGSGACVECTDGATDCTGSATASVCDGTSHTCRGCKAHSECVSDACDVESGACLAQSAVLYVSPTGSGSACTKASPCRQVTDAVSQLGGAKVAIRVSAGTYTGTLNLSGKTVTLYGEAGVVVNPPSGTVAIAIADTGNVEFRDMTLSGSGLGAGGTVVKCSVPSGGTPNLTLRHVTVTESTGVGVESSSCTLAVEQSTLTGNTGGGLSVNGGVFTVVNNFIVKNISSTGVGGVFVRGAAGSRFEHNTVAGNVADASAASAGVDCAVVGGLEARFNIITKNNEGDVSNDDQVTGTCTHTVSLIGPKAVGSNSTTPATFVDEVNKDYHLMPSSAGVSAATGSTEPKDVDDEARPHGGGPDIGADEVYP